MAAVRNCVKFAVSRTTTRTSRNERENPCGSLSGRFDDEKDKKKKNEIRRERCSIERFISTVIIKNKFAVKSTLSYNAYNERFLKH